MINIDKNNTENPLVTTVKEVWSHPVGKVVICLGVGYAVLYAAGFGFRGLAFTTRGFKEFTSALNS